MLASIYAQCAHFQQRVAYESVDMEQAEHGIVLHVKLQRLHLLEVCAAQLERSEHQHARLYGVAIGVACRNFLSRTDAGLAGEVGREGARCSRIEHDAALHAVHLGADYHLATLHSVGYGHGKLCVCRHTEGGSFDTPSCASAPSGRAALTFDTPSSYCQCCINCCITSFCRMSPKMYAKFYLL